ncbi:hypothetical protein AAFF_G00249600 [Aldrovandia affinis]|uniref:Tesmin/TSO1-like CXC domain-containing protein n=1 Tax=Aldrovandia affinis TaxID=143900 RepID=A0AAD7RDK8_9TELE|nr:hypothetical protein AAFF_G00249600 [Aldrovandia affinis]
MEAYEGFKRDRLEDEKPKTQFHDKMTKKRLKMFSDIRKKPSASNPNKVILQADRKLFAHMVLVAESRHLQMSDVLSHSLGPLPWALANGDGTLRKTNKAVLARGWRSSSANKANLIRFLVAEWKTPKLRDRLNDKQLYVASEESCLHITKDQWAEVASLQSNQEEADTRMILNAAHAAEEGYSAVVVTADDTDVLLLCLAFYADISCPLFQNCGTKNGNDDGQLTVEWMRGSPAPEAVLQLLSCNCSRRCKLLECQCMSSGLKCTNLCKLQTCDNQPQEEGLGMMITVADLTDSETED